MINLIHIIARGMPAAQAAAGQHASMLIGAVCGAIGKPVLRRLQSAMLGLAKPESFAYAMVGFGNYGNYSSNGFGATNPPFDDNSPGKARLKLR